METFTSNLAKHPETVLDATKTTKAYQNFRRRTSAESHPLSVEHPSIRHILMRCIPTRHRGKGSFPAVFYLVHSYFLRVMARSGLLLYGPVRAKPGFLEARPFFCDIQDKKDWRSSYCTKPWVLLEACSDPLRPVSNRVTSTFCENQKSGQNSAARKFMPKSAIYLHIVTFNASSLFHRRWRIDYLRRTYQGVKLWPNESVRKISSISKLWCKEERQWSINGP